MAEEETFDVKKLPSKIGQFFSTKIEETVKEAAKQVRSCLQLVSFFQLYKLRQAVKKLPGALEKLSEGASEASGEEGGIGNALSFGEDALKTVKESAEEAKVRSEKFITGMGKKLKPEIKSSLESVQESLQAFVGLISGGGFSMTTPSFDSFGDFSADVIPESLKNAPAKMFHALLDAGDAVIEKYAIFSSAILSIVKPGEVGNTGILDRVDSLLEKDDEEVQMATVLLLWKMGSDDEHKDACKEKLTSISNSDSVAADVKAKAGVALIAIGTGAGLASGVSDAVGNVADGATEKLGGLGKSIGL